MAIDIPVSCIKAVFWCAILLPIYSYAGYPLLIIAVGGMVRWIGRAGRGRLKTQETTNWPAVAIVVSAYNEESHIADLLLNLRSLDYPGTLRLYIGSDGSNDRTAEILLAQADDRMRTLVIPRNRGKASMLNDLLAIAVEPIVAFTDANTRLEPAALRCLVENFADRRVGAVCGELVLRSGGRGDNVDNIYWRIERLIKVGESALGGLLGANGGIYAVRRECFVPIRPDTVTDDFCIAMSVAAGGRRVVYESAARAVEDVPPKMRDEFGRRVRIGIGNYQAFFRHPEYLLGSGAMTGFSYLSHKVLRWFTPHLLLLALLANSLLLNQPIYRLLWCAQVLTYGGSMLLYALSHKFTVPKPLRIPVFLVAMNLAFSVGFWRYLSGRYLGAWERTSRA